MSTKILFPRFETEMPPAGELASRQLIRPTTPRPWLADEQVALLLNPETETNVGNPNRLIARPEWYGIHYEAVESIPYGRMFNSSFSSGPVKLFRSRLLRHNYQWDHLAVSGSASEIVLERLTETAPEFQELMALLVITSERRQGQRLIMADEDGEWEEPQFGSQDPRRQFYFEVLSQLAIRKAVPSGVIEVAL